jgi:peptide/nickel transport system ATP-binding protein
MTASPSPPGTLLEVRDLTIRYRGDGGYVIAARDINFSLKRGGSLAIVGESGSGKSSVASAILGFLGPAGEVSGSILFDGREMIGLPSAQRRQILGSRIGAVFQDPFTALNPALRVGRQIAEPLVQHLGLPLQEALARAERALREMGIERAAEAARAFPHQLSGGMKQRALIAAALVCEPSLLILDEPTTALDVTVEAQILRLLSRQRHETGVSLLFISHNLGVVQRLCEDVAVMYAGQLVELGDVGRVLEQPAHPYSKGLLASRPALSAAPRGGRLASIAGQMPMSPAPEAGCVFGPRCPFHESRCSDVPQPIAIVADGHQVRCWKASTLGAWPLPTAGRADQPVFRRASSLVNVNGLSKTFGSNSRFTRWRLSIGNRRPRLYRRPGQIPAVNNVSFSISPGEVLGLVGESGCGKSTLGRLLLQLLTPNNGSVEFDGANVARLSRPALRPFRRQAQIVFQNVGSSLNPRLSIGETLERPLKLFNLAKPRERLRRVEELLEMVRLPVAYRRRFPHQLSGGERQRVAIARALATEPRFIVCDEPVSALDVSVQATIVNLLADLRDAFGLSYLFISHDLAVVSQLSDRVAVMYRGEICEIGTTAEVLAPPYHPYTKMLLASAADQEVSSMARTGTSAEGNGAREASGGCGFAARCPHRLGPVCDATPPALRAVSESHAIACHLDAAAC